MFKAVCNVESIIMKRHFCFVNTSSVKQALLAVEALQGVTVNDGQISIKFAKCVTRACPLSPQPCRRTHSSGAI